MSDTLTRFQKVGILQQVKTSNHWDNPATAASNFKQCNYDRGISLPSPDVQVDEFNWNGANSISKEVGRIYVDQYGLHKLPFQFVATKALLAGHLAAAINKVTEGSATPYTKVFSMLSAQPKFSDNEGYLFSVAQGNIDTGSAGDGTILENAIIDNFTLEIVANNRSIAKLMTMKGDWIGNAIQTEQHFTGSWVAMPTTGFYNDVSFFQLSTLMVGTTDLHGKGFRRFAMTLNNNVKAESYNLGKPSNYAITPNISYEIDLPYNSDTYKALKSYMSGDNVDLLLTCGDGLTDGTMKLISTKNILTANPEVVDGDYLAIKLKFDRLYDPSGGNEILTISDAVDWGF